MLWAASAEVVFLFSAGDDELGTDCFEIIPARCRLD
jgi:hypothetical protein